MSLIDIIEISCAVKGVELHPDPIAESGVVGLEQNIRRTFDIAFQSFNGEFSTFSKSKVGNFVDATVVINGVLTGLGEDLINGVGETNPKLLD